MKRTAGAIALLLMTAAAGVCQTGSQASEGPPELLANQADAVVVGQVQSGQQTGYSVNFALSVVRSLKGALTAGTTVKVTGSVGSAQSRTLGGQYGLWFLKSAGGGWELLRWNQGRGGFEISGYLAMAPAASPVAMSATMSPTVAPSSLSDQMALELGAAIQSYSNPSTLFSAAWNLNGIGQSKVLPGVYQTLRASSDPEIRFIGLIGAWNVSGDLSALGEIADNVSAVTKLHASSVVGSSICGARDSRPAAVRHLAKIASASDPNMARCAIMALDYIHTQESLPFLAQALDSADPQTRDFAMQGLSRFVDNLPIQNANNVTNGGALVAQGPTPYRTPQTDEYSLSRGPMGSASKAEYLQFWKSWWAAMQDKFTGK